jgi:hypothetical protein
VTELTIDHYTQEIVGLSGELEGGTMIYLMDKEEIEEFKQTVKKHWKDVSLKDIDIGIQYNKRLRQQMEIRIEVLEEMKLERQSDRKSKQYPD